MDVIYREFQDTDKESIIVCLVDLVRYIATINPRRLTEPLTEYGESYFRKISGYVQKGTGTIIVAEVNGVIVGCGVGYVKEQSPEELLEFRPIKQGFIPDLCVKDVYRHKGIGSALLHQVEQFLKEKGCSSAVLEVLVDNQLAHQLYQDLGYRDFHMEMVRKL